MRGCCVLASLVLLLTCGCGGELAPIPSVDLARLEPAVATKLEAERRRVEELSARQAPAAERARALGTLGAHYHAYGFLPSAEASYANAEALEPEVFRWAYLRGRARLALGRFEPAVESFRRAAELNAADAAARLGLGQALLAAGKAREARAAFEAALARDPESAEALFHLGQLASEEGDLNAAIRHLERALALDPAAGPIERSLAGVYTRAGDRARAAALAQRASKGGVTSRDPWMKEVNDLASAGRASLDRGAVAFAAGRFDEARASFEQAVAALPDDAEAHLNLGSALLRLGRTAEAEASYRRSLALDGRRALVHFNLGTLLAATGRREEAHRHYREALVLDPNHVDAHFNLANSLLTVGEFAGADAEFGRTLELAPAHAPARLGRSVALLKLGHAPEANRVLEEGFAGQPNDPYLQHGLARLLAAAPDSKLRDGSRARALAERLVAANKNLEHVVALAMAEAEAGHFAAAISWQRQALAAVAAAGRPELAPPLERNLALYEAGKPCRTPWVAEDFRGRWP